LLIFKIRQKIAQLTAVKARHSQYRDDPILKPDTSKPVGLRDKAKPSVLFNLGTGLGAVAALRGKDIFEKMTSRYSTCNVKQTAGHNNPRTRMKLYHNKLQIRIRGVLG